MIDEHHSRTKSSFYQPFEPNPITMVLARSLIFIFAALAHASKHELIVANFLNGFLYTVDFDDETLTLDLAANITVPVPSSWISFSVCVPV